MTPNTSNAPQKHPLDTLPFYRRWLISWPKVQAKLCQKTIFQQDMHYELPIEDLVERNELLLQQAFQKKNGLIKSILSVYKKDFTFLALRTLTFTVLNYSSSLFLYFILQILIQHSKKKETDSEINIYGLGSWLLYIALANTMSNFIYNYNVLEMARLSVRVRTGVTALIGGRIMTYNQHFYQGTTSGEIINHIQIDANKFELTVIQIVSLFTNIFQTIIGMLLFYIFIGWAFLGTILTFMVLNFAIGFLYKFLMKLNERIMEAKDKRINLLQEVIPKIKLLKYLVWEDHYENEIAQRRAKEVSLFVKKAFVQALIGLSVYWTLAASLIMTLIWLLASKESSKFASFACFISMYAYLTAGLRGLPTQIQNVLSIKVAINRINKFLNSEPISYSQFKDEFISAQLEKKVIAQISQGEFYFYENEKEENPLNKTVDDLTHTYQRKQSKSLNNSLNKGDLLETIDPFSNNTKGALQENLLSLEEQSDYQQVKNYQEDSVQQTDQVTELSISQQEASVQLPPKTKIELTKQPQSVVEKKIEFKLRNINLEIRQGELIFLLGAVGSGKSSLLRYLIGEIKSQKGSVTIPEKIGYLQSTPWLISKTIAQNIAIKHQDQQEIDQTKMNKAIKLSQLEEELKLFPDGVDSMLGSNGVNISGGQKIRVGLARLLYDDQDLYLFDGMFNSLDNDVGKEIFDQVIMGHLGQKARVIATHHDKYCQMAENHSSQEKKQQTVKILYISLNGAVKTFHSYKQYQLFKDNEEKGEDNQNDVSNGAVSQNKSLNQNQSSNQLDEAKSQVQDQKTFDNELSKTSQEQSIISIIASLDEVLLLEKNSTKDNQNLETFFLKEDKKEGKISLEVLRTLIQKMGGKCVFSIIFLTAMVFCFLSVFSDYQLLVWGKEKSKATQYSNLWLLGLVLSLKGVAAFIRSFTIGYFSSRMSRRLHANMVKSVFDSPLLTFLERVPTGRIVNRFTSDIDLVDSSIGFSISLFSLFVSFLLFQILIICWNTTFLMLIPIAVFIYLGIRMQQLMSGARREFTRLEQITRSPIVTWTQEALEGVEEIRLYRIQNLQINEMRNIMNENLKNAVSIFGVNAWFQSRIGLLNLVLILLPSFSWMLYTFYENFDVKWVVLFLLYGTELSNDLITTLQMVSDLESQLVSLERCSALENLLPEEGHNNVAVTEEKLQSIKDNLDIERQSVVSFQEVSAKYPTREELVLKDINFKVFKGERVAIIGRTGSGKSTLAKLLLNTLQPIKGEVRLYQKDVLHYNLKQLRSQIGYVSQETTLFKGTLLNNIIPRAQNIKDIDIKSLKQITNLLEMNKASSPFFGYTLDYEIEENGNNLSSGQQQMITILRSGILGNKDVFVLDEATSNIDEETESKWMEIIQNKGKTEEERRAIDSPTMIIIAHRLKTIKSCDKVFLLDNGRIIKEGAPGDFEEYFKKNEENDILE